MHDSTRPDETQQANFTLIGLRGKKGVCSRKSAKNLPKIRSKSPTGL